MKTIEDHIQKDKEILADPSTSEPMLYTKEDVKYAKLIRKAIKYEEQRHVENQSK